MKHFVKVMKALSEPNRLKILKILQRKACCVYEIKETLGMAQPTVSKHLRILKTAGLVSAEKHGLWVEYHISDGRCSPYAATLMGNLRHWLNEDSEIQETMEKMQNVDFIHIMKR
ncbi:MAG: winged helix-turn-helix transcriptional regulator [Deltaproteobacteria bacterium]|nr:winged helix-turn-helix transcriptional regulator [Deltaproteobacteria bacterium]MBN2845986.1 winged helix-turn-helix transcriptional regulator [Deltaproteobacteria bacterium]